MPLDIFLTTDQQNYIANCAGSIDPDAFPAEVENVLGLIAQYDAVRGVAIGDQYVRMAITAAKQNLNPLS